jgi:hypothetical protein
MRNHRRAAELTGTQLGSISWFISFGDLLTLLVCFFLLLTPRLAMQREQMQRQQGFSNSTESLQILGTDLASRKSDVKGTSVGSVPVWQSDLGLTDEARSSGSLRADWVSLLVDKVSQGAIATVQVCDAESEKEVLSQVMRELVVVGTSASRVTFELEAECIMWRKHFASPQQLAAVVHFS